MVESLVETMGLRGWLRREGPFWLLTLMLLLSLILSTSLKYLHGSPPSITTSYFYFKAEIKDKRIQGRFPDMGKYPEAIFEYSGSEYWKLCADWGDVTRYLYQAETGKLIYTPYRYRPLGIWLAGGVAWLTGMPVSYAFVLNNILAVLAAAILFLLYLKRFHGFNRYLALLGSILFVTSTAVVSSLPFPLIDSLTYPLIVLVFWFVRSREPLPFILVSLVGVLTKEVMGIAGPLYLVANLRREEGWKEKGSTIAVSLVPVLGYFAVRLVAGGGIDEVSYGYNLLTGEFPTYYIRLLYWRGLWIIFANIFSAFGFLWLGLFNLRRERFLLKAFLIVAIPVFLATVLFSARISRPLGLLFPIVIPLFLLYFRRFGLEDRLGGREEEGG